MSLIQYLIRYTSHVALLLLLIFGLIKGALAIDAQDHESTLKVSMSNSGAQNKQITIWLIIQNQTGMTLNCNSDSVNVSGPPLDNLDQLNSIRPGRINIKLTSQSQGKTGPNYKLSCVIDNNSEENFATLELDITNLLKPTYQFIDVNNSKNILVLPDKPTRLPLYTNTPQQVGYNGMILFNIDKSVLQEDRGRTKVVTTAPWLRNYLISSIY